MLAEREGFEPPIRLPVCRISSAVLSTTQPPLQAGRGRISRVASYVAKRLEPNKRGSPAATAWRARPEAANPLPALLASARSAPSPARGEGPATAAVPGRGLAALLVGCCYLTSS